METVAAEDVPAEEPAQERGKVIFVKKFLDESAIYARGGDFPLFIITLSLVLFGVVMVFSASYYYAMNQMGSPYYYLIRDSIWAIVGYVAMHVVSTIDYHKLQKLAPLVLIVSIILLCAVFTPLGKTLNNATRWLDFKVFTVMPGEIAKPAVILFVAAFLSKDPTRIRSLGRGVVPLMVVAAVIFALIYKQPNTTTAATVVIIILGMMFIAGINMLYVGGLVGLGVMGLITMILADPHGYRLRRVTNFLHPLDNIQGTGYQVSQGLFALGSGGLFGVGIGNSIQKTLYLPEPQNDFILAIIGEELGFIGLLLLLLVYLLFLWRIVHIAIKAPDMFGTLLASGFGIMFAAHIIFNIMIVTAKMPPTGIILPFISWGGNALVIFMACVGVLLNISKQIEKGA